jgi:hypothetical protein
LIESQEETHLWAKTFDRVMNDMLTLQTEVAEEIARAVTEALARPIAASIPAPRVPDVDDRRSTL